MPYNLIGDGPRILVILQGLQFENKPLTGVSAGHMLSTYSFLRAGHTTYAATRRPGLPDGTSMQDMADDYATIIKEELPAPVDVIGTLTGGWIAQHLAADHPNLVRRLVIHSSAYTLGDAARRSRCAQGTRQARENGGRPARSY